MTEDQALRIVIGAAILAAWQVIRSRLPKKPVKPRSGERDRLAYDFGKRLSKVWTRAKQGGGLSAGR
jgi:hypothetical protein